MSVVVNDELGKFGCGRGLLRITAGQALSTVDSEGLFQRVIESTAGDILFFYGKSHILNVKFHKALAYH